MRLGILDFVGSKAGMQEYSQSLADSFKKNKFSCFVYSNYPGSIKFFSSSFLNPTFKFFNFLFGFLLSIFHAKINRVDVIFVHIYSVGYKELFFFTLCFIFRIKAVIIWHDVESLFMQDIRFFKRLVISSLSYKIIVHNKYSLEKLCKFVKEENLNMPDILVSNHGISISDRVMDVEFNISNSLTSFISSYDKIILFFGQIKKVKGLDLLLSSFQNLPLNYGLVIAGRPVENDWYRYQEIIDKNSLGSRVFPLLRFIDDNERDYLFSSSDLIVLPYYEIFQSGVLLNAMSHSLPVLASDLIPNREIISHGLNGFLFESGNLEDLSLRIVEVFSGKYNRSIITKRALLYLDENCNWDILVHNILKFIIKK